MDKLIVHGGTPIHGAITISGSKNASLPILAATLLTEEDCVIRRVPDVSDTNYMVQILTGLGSDAPPPAGVRSIGMSRISNTRSLAARADCSIWLNACNRPTGS